MSSYSPITETKNFIILDSYSKIFQVGESYQTERDLENEFITDLKNQGYEYRKDLTTNEKILENIKIQLEELNDVKFSNSEWDRFCEEYLNKPNDTQIDKTRKIHNDYIYDFIFDDGHIKNIYLVDKKSISRNRLQVISQFNQRGTVLNRYDVTILVNGLPMVQIELKKRGIAIREAFNQINRYSKESFNTENSLYKYLQLYVISNGTDTRYFANTIKRDKNSFDFTMNWAKADNTPIKDLKDFTATFFQKNTILSVLLNYSVFDSNENLLIMRPYQIAATERILWKIKSTYLNKKWKSIDAGGYIWHTTGSGKTLTSFKVARLATELDFIDKVFFVVDRKDLDYQTIKEYQRFSPDSVNGSENTVGLKRNIEKDDNRIIVTTIQKLNNLIKNEADLDIYNRNVVFIFDEAHRSQFGEAQKNIKKKFKKYCQFGFTGTPIFPENALGAETTGSVFGNQLHSYVITDAIRDEKVLKFKVDYNDVRPNFENIEKELDEKKLSALEEKKAFLHPERIKEISRYILNNFNVKTHRTYIGEKGFNAMFAVSSVDAAKQYYETLKNLQKDSKNPLKIATIFSFAPNEEQNSIGEILDENFEPTAMNTSAKEFLTLAINDYNEMFKTNYGIESRDFQNYYRDLANRVKKQEIDLLIVVGMFLTGFDAPTLNTLFVDKNLRYHGLIQAFSRTNRIYNSTKSFGNIVTFRDLEQATIDAITLFGNANTKNVILEKSYEEYMNGFKDIISGENKKGYLSVIEELKNRFPSIEDIVDEKDKKEFVKLFGEYLKVENVLQNYDEFTKLKAIQTLDIDDSKALEEFKTRYYVSDDEIRAMKEIKLPTEREIQDYCSTYNDIREWLRRERAEKDGENLTIDWNDVIFEIDLLKSQEINLSYILGLIFEKNKKLTSKELLVEDIRRLIRASIGNRAKESLIVDFINKTDLNKFEDKASVIEGFFNFAKEERAIEEAKLIDEEKLNKDMAKRYISRSLKREYASENGTELNEVMPKMSPLNPNYLPKKKSIFEKISAFVEKFKGIGKED
ncbi:type I restriction endonuclease subunit R [Fusobacterium sp. SYSU M8D902]|uniref:type I restriction endonuclease subunit R n=1 Tax=Fusobacterium sp. SYSU M8D902 TaxID=3159562 RepID=UPI0032E3FB32